MNVRAFTASESSGLDPDIRGSYLGVIEKVIVDSSKMNDNIASADRKAQYFWSIISEYSLQLYPSLSWFYNNFAYFSSNFIVFILFSSNTSELPEN